MFFTDYTLYRGGSRGRLFATPWTTAHQASLSFTVSRSLLKLTSVESVMLPFNLLSPPFPSVFNLFQHQGLFYESALCIRWPKYWSSSISPSNEFSGLISIRIDWFDLLDLQGTLKSLLQHHNLNASILQHSAFLMVQLSHPYMTNGKTIALTRWAFASKGMSLLFNMLSRFVIAFLLRRKHLLISLSAVILEPK